MTQCTYIANDVDTSVLCTEKSSCIEQSTNKINLILIFEANITHATKDKQFGRYFQARIEIVLFHEKFVAFRIFFDLVVFFSIQNKLVILDSPNRSNVSENEKKTPTGVEQSGKMLSFNIYSNP